MQATGHDNLDVSLSLCTGVKWHLGLDPHSQCALMFVPVLQWVVTWPHGVCVCVLCRVVGEGEACTHHHVSGGCGGADPS